MICGVQKNSSFLWGSSLNGGVLGSFASCVALREARKLDAVLENRQGTSFKCDIVCFHAVGAPY